MISMLKTITEVTILLVAKTNKAYEPPAAFELRPNSFLMFHVRGIFHRHTRNEKIITYR